MTERTYEYHAKCENKDCRDFSFLFAAVTTYPVKCRVCHSECKVVAVHPVTLYRDEGGQG